jgi:hypothetical protein
VQGKRAGADLDRTASAFWRTQTATILSAYRFLHPYPRNPGGQDRAAEYKKKKTERQSSTARVETLAHATVLLTNGGAPRSPSFRSPLGGGGHAAAPLPPSLNLYSRCRPCPLAHRNIGRSPLVTPPKRHLGVPTQKISLSRVSQTFFSIRRDAYFHPAHPIQTLSTGASGGTGWARDSSRGPLSATRPTVRRLHSPVSSPPASNNCTGISFAQRRSEPSHQNTSWCKCVPRVHARRSPRL